MKTLFWGKLVFKEVQLSGKPSRGPCKKLQKTLCTIHKKIKYFCYKKSKKVSIYAIKQPFSLNYTHICKSIFLVK